MTLKEYKINPNVLEVTKHIKKRYVSITEKKTAAEIVARVSCYDKNGNFRQDSVERYIWERILLLDLYTDFERSENIYADFDEANEIGLFDQIADIIPRKERDEWFSIVEMVCEDAVRNEYEIGGFVRNQVERFGQLAGVGLAGLDIDKLVGVIQEVTGK